MTKMGAGNQSKHVHLVFILIQKIWVSQVMGNKTFYADSLKILKQLKSNKNATAVSLNKCLAACSDIFGKRALKTTKMPLSYIEAATQIQLCQLLAVSC